MGKGELYEKYSKQSGSKMSTSEENQVVNISQVLLEKVEHDVELFKQCRLMN